MALEVTSGNDSHLTVMQYWSIFYPDRLNLVIHFPTFKKINDNIFYLYLTNGNTTAHI